MMKNKASNIYKETAIDLAAHLILAAGLVFFFRWLTGGWVWSILGFIGGILIDIDHFIDHFLYYGPKFRVADFFRRGYQKSGKCYVIFHSWEIIFVLWIISIKVSWVTPLATGMTIHIITDCMFTHCREILFLSLIYRWRNGFELEKISPEICARMEGSDQ